LEITEITICLRNEKKLKGFANVAFDDLFVVRGLKIIRGSKGYFVAMPSRAKRDGSFKDIAHPIRKEFRSFLEKIVLKRYWEEVKKHNPQNMHVDELSGVFSE